jgi:hypothetical protein
MPDCGAEATWNPAKQALVCNYCGTVAPMQPGTEGEGGVSENSLVERCASGERSARVGDGKAEREVPKLPGDHGV